MRFFGYKLNKGVDEERKIREASTLQVIEKSDNDGALEIGSNASGFYNYGVALDNSTVDEAALITKYRLLSEQQEVDKAIQDIINEAFDYASPTGPVDIDTQKIDIGENTRHAIKKEFDAILKMMNFKKDCYHIFRQWYVDGRIYYHKMIDEQNPANGIFELRNVDPRKIKKVKELIKNNKRIPSYANIITNSLEVNKKYIEYFVYNGSGVNRKNPQGIPISPNSITYVHSGIRNNDNTMILSNLHKAIKAYNTLRMMEDAVVIYRIARAPERRIFNIEVGNLPKMKAEQYVAEIMRKHNKKLKFDPETGQVSDDKRIATMLEDFWFPQRDGKGTTVETLPAGENLGQITDVEYFKKKLYEALEVPIGRLDSEGGFNIGRPSEISRDEVKFSDFVNRLRSRFAEVFLDILGDQLILKSVLTSTEWDKYKDDILIVWNENNFFTELKEGEIMQARISNLRDIEPYIGKFYSQTWVRTNVLHMSEEEWIQIKKEIDEEPEYQMSGFGGGMGMDGGGFGDPMGGGMGGMPGGDQFGAPSGQDAGGMPGQDQDDDDKEDNANPKQKWFS
jgi:hypothetical protein